MVGSDLLRPAATNGDVAGEDLLHLYPLDGLDLHNLLQLSTRGLSLVQFAEGATTRHIAQASVLYQRRRSNARKSGADGQDDLTFPLHDLPVLSSTQLALIRQHPGLLERSAHEQESLLLDAELLWFQRRNRDEEAGIQWTDTASCASLAKLAELVLPAPATVALTPRPSSTPEDRKPALPPALALAAHRRSSTIHSPPPKRVKREVPSPSPSTAGTSAVAVPLVIARPKPATRPERCVDSILTRRADARSALLPALNQAH